MRAWAGRGRLPSSQPRLVAGEPGPVAVQSLAMLPATAWQDLTVTEEAQGPRVYQFGRQRVWGHRAGTPARERWPMLRRNLDGSKRKYYFPSASVEMLLLTLAHVVAMCWAIETELRMGKGETGLDGYETRGWQSWHHHIILALLANAFLLSLEQEWGQKLPLITQAQISRAPRSVRP